MTSSTTRKGNSENGGVGTLDRENAKGIHILELAGFAEKIPKEWEFWKCKRVRILNVRPSKLKPSAMQGTLVVQILPREKNLQNSYCIFECFLKVFIHKFTSFTSFMSRRFLRPRKSTVFRRAQKNTSKSFQPIRRRYFDSCCCCIKNSWYCLEFCCCDIRFVSTEEDCCLKDIYFAFFCYQFHFQCYDFVDCTRTPASLGHFIREKRGLEVIKPIEKTHGKWNQPRTWNMILSTVWIAVYHESGTNFFPRKRL